MGIFNIFKKTSIANSAPQALQAKPMSTQEFNEYASKLESVVAPSGLLSPFDHMIISAFLYARQVTNTEFMFSNEVSVADSIFLACFVNTKRFSQNIRYENLREKYKNVMYYKTLKAFKFAYPKSQNYIDEMYESRNNYYNKIFEELDGSTENKLRAVFEEYINILLQNSVEKKFLPFHENSALNIFDINKMTRCQLEAKHFYASFDKLFGQSLSKAISYLDSIQADWDEFKKMREEQ